MFFLFFEISSSTYFAFFVVVSQLPCLFLTSILHQFCPHFFPSVFFGLVDGLVCDGTNCLLIAFDVNVTMLASKFLAFYGSSCFNGKNFLCHCTWGPPFYSLFYTLILCRRSAFPWSPATADKRPSHCTLVFIPRAFRNDWDHSPMNHCINDPLAPSDPFQHGFLFSQFVPLLVPNTIPPRAVTGSPAALLLPRPRSHVGGVKRKLVTNRNISTLDNTFPQILITHLAESQETTTKQDTTETRERYVFSSESSSKHSPSVHMEAGQNQFRRSLKMAKHTKLSILRPFFHGDEMK